MWEEMLDRKVKECERHLSASVMNSSWHLYMCRRGYCARVTHHGIYLQRVCMVYVHVYSMLLVQWNPILSYGMPAKYTLYSSCGC